MWQENGRPNMVSYKSKLQYKRPTESAYGYSVIPPFDLVSKLNNRLSIFYMLWKKLPKPLASTFDCSDAGSYCF